MNEGEMSFCEFDLTKQVESDRKEHEAEQEARAYALATTPGEHIRPRDLQAATKGALGFNAACRILEALAKDGELVRTTDPTYAGMLVWMRSQPATPPGRGYALPLSPKEHGALMRLLDNSLGYPREPLNTYAQANRQAMEDATLLRAIRTRLKRPA